MQDVLTTDTRRRNFYLLAALTLFLLIILRLHTFSSIESTIARAWLTSLTDDLSAALLGSIIAVSAIRWLWPTPLAEQARELPAMEIRSTLMEGVAGTKRRYLFRGRTGTFLTATVLPALAKQARNSRLSIEVSAQLLDPRNEALCDQYAAYRRRIAADTTTGNEVRLKILAHIVSAYSWNGSSSIHVSVCLSPSFSLLRYDISDRWAVATREDQRLPGMRFDGGTPFYGFLVEDHRMYTEQGFTLPAVTGIAATELTPRALREFLSQLQLQIPLTETDAHEVIRTARAPRDPYA